MNPLRNLFLLAACLLAVACASQSSNSVSNNMRPTEWLSVNELEALPAVNEINLQQLEKMSPEEGATLVNQIYHLSQIGQDISPSFVPSPSEIPCYIAQPNGQKAECHLDQLVATAKQQRNFGDDEVTIFITGLPPSSPAVTKATQKLVRAFMLRYNQNQQQKQQQQHDNDDSSSSEENNSAQSNDQEKNQTGDLIVIDLGKVLNSFQRYASLNTEKTGAMLGNILVELTNKVNVPQEMIKLIGQCVSAHVAGAAGRQYARLTGHKIRRITALDPSKIFAKNPNVLNGLARGDAEFVDAIHTSTNAIGTVNRVGDADFYPNGPSATMPGADNIVESAMRATRYFAESVRPGNERNFPAVAANSLQQYKNNNGCGKRVYMGVDTEFDVKGDYILQVNSKAPFGKAAPAQRQNNYHAAHKPWNSNSQDY